MSSLITEQFPTKRLAVYAVGIVSERKRARFLVLVVYDIEIGVRRTTSLRISGVDFFPQPRRPPHSARETLANHRSTTKYTSPGGSNVAAGTFALAT